MPYLKIQTNRVVSPEQSKKLLTKLSRQLAQELEKPERYVMVDLAAEGDMLFAGVDDPLAFVELKSIGLSQSNTQPLSKWLCDLLQDELGIPPERVYIEFTDIPRKFWGWNGSTF